MGQSIEAVPFVLPGVHEVWRLLLDIKEAGDGTPFAAYVEKMDEAKGTAYDFGWGARLGRPSADYVRGRRKSTYRPKRNATTSIPPTPKRRASRIRGRTPA